MCFLVRHSFNDGGSPSCFCPPSPYSLPSRRRGSTSLALAQVGVHSACNERSPIRPNRPTSPNRPMGPTFIPHFPTCPPARQLFSPGTRAGGIFLITCPSLFIIHLSIIEPMSPDLSDEFFTKRTQKTAFSGQYLHIWIACSRCFFTFLSKSTHPLVRCSFPIPKF